MILDLLFPPKCVLCHKLLTKQETDLCHSCRENVKLIPKQKRRIPFVAQWTAMWYYKEDVKSSIHRMKFFGARHYAEIYGRLLSMRIQEIFPEGFDVLTWVPISPARKKSRGFDQGQLLAKAVGKELGISPIRTLWKTRDTPPQSGFKDASMRRANVLGAYQVFLPKRFAGKRVLLLDDVITSGSTVSECARMLVTAGAKEVICAAVAAATNDKK